MPNSDQPQPVLVVLAVCDIVRSVAFYRACFDWRQTVNENVYAEFETSTSLRIGLYEKHAFGRTACGEVATPPDRQLTGAEIYFRVDDIESACERLASAGAHLASARAMRHWGDEAAYFRDPDGHLLVIAKKAH